MKKKLSDYWKIWKPLFPEFKHSDTLAIVGWAPTTRDFAPYEDRSIDMWVLNECADDKPEHAWMRRKDPTMLWQIHPVFDYMRKYNRNDPNHWKWLQEPHNFPVMMQNAYPEVPNSVAFPLKDACDAFGMYFTSTMSYEMALAILMDYKRIELYGIEMSADSEYIYQKASMEYMIGVARGRGIDVYMPPQCSLLRGALYAYEDLRAASRVYYGMRLKSSKDQLEIAAQQAFQSAGRLDMMGRLMDDPEIPGEVKQHMSQMMMQIDNERVEAHIRYGIVKGAVKELEDMIKWHDIQSIADDREDIPPEQIKAGQEARKEAKNGTPHPVS